jgi:hypothetical protein
MDERCLFQYDKGFIGKSTLTMRDALIMLMNFYKIEPASGTSHFLDVEI